MLLLKKSLRLQMQHQQVLYVSAAVLEMAALAAVSVANALLANAASLNKQRLMYAALPALWAVDADSPSVLRS
jgi:hypothetical protein